MLAGSFCLERNFDLNWLLDRNADRSVEVDIRARPLQRARRQNVGTLICKTAAPSRAVSKGSVNIIAQPHMLLIWADFHYAVSKIHPSKKCRTLSFLPWILHRELP